MNLRVFLFNKTGDFGWLLPIPGCLLAAAGNAARGRKSCYPRPLVALLAAASR